MASMYIGNLGQLESVVGQVQAGATLYLKAGEHRLSRPLKIELLGRC
jgi:hypothetical protein